MVKSSRWRRWLISRFERRHSKLSDATVSAFLRYGRDARHHGDINDTVRDEFMPELQERYPSLQIIKGGWEEQQVEFFAEVTRLFTGHADHTRCWLSRLDPTRRSPSSCRRSLCLYGRHFRASDARHSARYVLILWDGGSCRSSRKRQFAPSTTSSSVSRTMLYGDY